MTILQFFDNKNKMTRLALTNQKAPWDLDSSEISIYLNQSE